MRYSTRIKNKVKHESVVQFLIERLSQTYVRIQFFKRVFISILQLFLNCMEWYGTLGDLMKFDID